MSSNTEQPVSVQIISTFETLNQDQIAYSVYASTEDLACERIDKQEMCDIVSAAAPKLDERHIEVVEGLLKQR